MRTLVQDQLVLMQQGDETIGSVFSQLERATLFDHTVQQFKTIPVATDNERLDNPHQNRKCRSLVADVGC